VSGDVPFTALTSNQFAEGMRKIYDLEPLIKLQLFHQKQSNVTQEDKREVLLRANG
jgi:hypothetical protein